MRSGKASEATSKCEEGLGEFPEDANLMCLAARGSLAMRRFDLAREYVQSALREHPDFPLAHDINGDLLLIEGSFEEALDAYEQSLAFGAAESAVAKKIEKAKQLHEDAKSQAKRPAMAFADQIAVAEKHERAGERKEAETIYRRILRSDPDHVEASRLLAGIAVSYDQFREAEVFLRRAAEIAPDYVRVWVDLANVQRELEKFDEAIESATKVMELAPGTAEAFMVYGGVVGVAGRHEEAIVAFEKSIALDPGKPSAHCSMAHHLKTIGRQDDAIAKYREAIALRKDHAESYWSLANLKTFRFEDAEVDTMRQLLDSDELPDLSRAQIHNALGLEHEARKNYDLAFDHFSQCNLVKRKSESYDPVDTEDTHDRVIALFDEAFLAQPPGDVQQPTPIFIVGLPRSGSTLIEQILASHSMVDGTHELSDLSKVIRAMRRGDRQDKRFPEVVGNLNESGWSRIGAQYLQRSAKHRDNAPFFIDKNPNNYVFGGLIKLAIPNARIINARRHPLDSCLGSFKQLFASGQTFSYDMTELAEYYLQYQRLVDHWHEAMPGFVLDVHYENVVADLETEVQRILDFCGLPFEEACLRFHETERAVKTASSEQVRKPIYSSSVNLWRHYEKHLDLMVHIMEPLLTALPENDQPTLLFQTKQNSPVA